MKHVRARNKMTDIAYVISEYISQKEQIDNCVDLRSTSVDAISFNSKIISLLPMSGHFQIFYLELLFIVDAATNGVNYLPGCLHFFVCVNYCRCIGSKSTK